PHATRFRSGLDHACGCQRGSDHLLPGGSIADDRGELLRHVFGGTGRIVGQEQKRVTGFLQRTQRLVGAGDGGPASVYDAVEVTDDAAHPTRDSKRSTTVVRSWVVRRIDSTDTRSSCPWNRLKNSPKLSRSSNRPTP